MDPITIIGAATLGFIIGQGGHQMDGFRDTGCDPSAQVAIISERTGEVLYYNNPTCPMATGPSDSVAGPTTPDNGDDNGGGNEGSNGNGNASANNGKGGNYDQTGHSDNGKGNGNR